MTPYRYARIIGVISIVIGALVLARDILEVHSVPYGIAGIGLVAFGAWRLQAAARLRP